MTPWAEKKMSVLFCWSVHLFEIDGPQKFLNTSFYYFSIVKIPLGLVTLRWATASSRLNTWHVRSPLVSGAFSI